PSRSDRGGGPLRWESLALEPLPHLGAGPRPAEVTWPVPARDARVAELPRRIVQVHSGLRGLGIEPDARRSYSGQKSSSLSPSASSPLALIEQMISSASSGPSLWTERNSSVPTRTAECGPTSTTSS